VSNVRPPPARDNADTVVDMDVTLGFPVAVDHVTDSQEEDVPDEGNRAGPAGIPPWFISFAVHALLALFFWAVVSLFALRSERLYDR
jgi:hypothetical protein